MYNILRTRDIKIHLQNGYIFNGYDTKHPQFATFHMENGELIQIRKLKHPINVGEPSVEVKNDLRELLSVLPDDAILLTTIGNTSSGIAVEVVTNLTTPMDEIIREELSSGTYLHLTIASPPLLINSVPGHKSFSTPYAVDTGRVVTSVIDGVPSIHPIASSKMGRLRISEANLKNSKGVYLILEGAEKGYMCIYHRSLPFVLQQAIVSGDIAPFVGMYLEFSYRTVNNCANREVGEVVVTREVTCCMIHNIAHECNGPLLWIK